MVPKEREVSLEKIKNNPAIKVILISFKAGSTGLNLTACNHVILVDMWWNPALEVSSRPSHFARISVEVSVFVLLSVGSSFRSCTPIRSEERCQDL